jgi:uncharacterized oligopeptide transporter (OPT) family protein
VLIAGEKGGVHARTVFEAFGLAFVYKFLMEGLKLWNEYPSRIFESFQRAEVTMEVGPELMGVGYIIGPRIAGYLFAGGCLAYLVLMPVVRLFGDSMLTPMYPATTLIKDMSAGQIRAAFVFYIGAGAVATSGIIALARALPTIGSAFAGGFASLKESRAGQLLTSSRSPSPSSGPWCSRSVSRSCRSSRSTCWARSSSSSSRSSSRRCRRGFVARSAARRTRSRG